MLTMRAIWMDMMPEDRGLKILRRMFQHNANTFRPILTLTPFFLVTSFYVAMLSFTLRKLSDLDENTSGDRTQSIFFARSGRNQETAWNENNNEEGNRNENTSVSYIFLETVTDTLGDKNISYLHWNTPKLQLSYNTLLPHPLSESTLDTSHALPSKNYNHHHPFWNENAEVIAAIQLADRAYVRNGHGAITLGHLCGQQFEGDLGAEVEEISLSRGKSLDRLWNDVLKH
ncbi:hypothetical protein BDQ17DRAFT_1331402 [Cyathus striatus]|nr:hypothetical protein BDQ17DRAFT_1331402 [Cyathus striatus]